MCCSDKMAMWNCVGIQGALMSMFLVEPIYLSSMIIGGGPLYCHRAISRAVCCRMGRQCQSEIGVQLDGPYKVNHPTLIPAQGFVKGEHGRCSSEHSMNWFKLIDRENHPEFINGNEGVPSALQVEESPILVASRLCKDSKWQRFKEMCNAWPSPPYVPDLTYGAAKKSSEEYQKAKEKVRAYFKEPTRAKKQVWSNRGSFLPKLEDF